MSPHSSILTSMTPDCEETEKAGAACKDTSRDAALHYDNTQASEVFAMSDTSINPVGNNSEPNHQPLKKPVVKVPRMEALKVM